MKNHVELRGKFGAKDYQDLALVESIKRGNQAAFTMLFKKYYPHLSRKIFFALRNRQDAEDITSEIFQKLYDNIDKYEPQYTFNAWLTRLAHNHMIDFILKNKRNILCSSLSLDAPVDNGDESGGSTLGDILVPKVDVHEYESMLASPEVERMAKLKVVYSTIDKMVDNAVLSLPKLTQEIFRKFNDDGKTPVEISEEYGIDLSDVELHIKKGYDRYDRAGVERKILKMYLMDEMPYEKISSELNIKLNTLKVMIMRAKEKLIKSINLKMAVIEVSGVYTLDQLNLDDWYNTCPDSQ